MKKIYLSIFTALAGLSLNAQTLTQANNAPASGDVFSTWQCDSLAISPGASGANATWNFASIATHSSTVKNYAATTNTNTSYPMPGVSVGSSATDMSYYKSASNNLSYWGGNINVGSTTAALIYTASAVRASYPMALNTTSSSVTGGSISVLSQNGTFTGNSTTLADGTGTLVLPSGTYNNVIRVVTTQTINFNATVAGVVTQKNWDYFDAATKEPWFSISTTTLSVTFPPSAPSTQTIVTRRNPAIVTGVNANAFNAAEVAVYPNPATTEFNVVTANADAKNVVVYDVTGKVVTTQNLTNGKLKLDVSDYTNGLYIYSVIGTNNQTLKTGKITVSH